MELSRRDFIKASGAGVASVLLLGALNPDVALAKGASTLPLRK
ncbi:twin-arginine translocation signal domain-containing protein, partial [Chloroflexota bacterium]